MAGVSSPCGSSSNDTSCAAGDPSRPQRSRRHVRAAQQRDAADEGRLEPSGSKMIGPVIVNQDEVVRPSQLIASVRRTDGAQQEAGLVD